MQIPGIRLGIITATLLLWFVSLYLMIDSSDNLIKGIKQVGPTIRLNAPEL
jgi:hypothetical protein